MPVKATGEHSTRTSSAGGGTTPDGGSGGARNARETMPAVRATLVAVPMPADSLSAAGRGRLAGGGPYGAASPPAAMAIAVSGTAE